MDTTKSATSGGRLARLKCAILAMFVRWNVAVYLCAHRILLSYIPTSLLAGLLCCYRGARRLKKLWPWSPGQLGVEFPVYDVVNCGARSQYVIAADGGGLVVHNCLASDYGAGWRKIYRTARAEGFSVTEDEAKRLWQGQRDVHAAVYEQLAPALEAEWERNGGWVLGLMGQPTPVWGERLRDLVNRVVQRGGHDCHILFAGLVDARLTKIGMQHQWVVIDFHDQLIVQVPMDRCAEVEDEIRAAMADLNSGLAMTIQLKGEPASADNLGAVKMPEKYKEKYG